MARAIDYLIVGQGLAGTALGWHLRERGAHILILDREEKVTSSKIAAGIMTPVTGMRMVKSWRIDELWPYAKAFYRRLEKKLGAVFFHETPIVRLFKSKEEVELWAKRVQEERAIIGDYFREGAALDFRGTRVVAPFGGFEMRNCGYVDVPRFLDLSRNAFVKAGMFRGGEFDEARIDPRAEDIVWEGILVRKGVILCVGFEARASRYFDWVPFKAAKGEILTVELDGVAEDRILNRGNWLLPLGGGRFRTGTTYEWKRLDNEPTEAARREIEANLKELVDAEHRVVGHEAAVRPIVNESKVLLGRHPAYPSLGFFNGLGSKGVLNAPFFADRFAAHLEEGAPIEAEIDLRKNF